MPTSAAVSEDISFTQHFLLSINKRFKFVSPQLRPIVVPLPARRALSHLFW